MEFLDKKRFEGITLDAPNAEKLTKLMDWYVIRLEDGTDELAAKLLNDETRSVVSRPSTSPTKEVRVPETEKEDSKENGKVGKKAPKIGSEDGAASDSEEEKRIGAEQEGKKASTEVDDELENGSTEGKTDQGEKDKEIGVNEVADKEASPKKRTLSGESGGDPQSVGSLDEDEEKSNFHAQSKQKTEEKEKPKVEEAETEELPQLHRTSSVFLRNISPGVSKAEVDALCVKHPGFLRTALADPQPERRWYRRGWVTFKRNVNIKGVQSNCRVL